MCRFNVAGRHGIGQRLQATQTLFGQFAGCLQFGHRGHQIRPLDLPGSRHHRSQYLTPFHRLTQHRQTAVPCFDPASQHGLYPPATLRIDHHLPGQLDRPVEVAAFQRLGANRHLTLRALGQEHHPIRQTLRQIPQIGQGGLLIAVIVPFMRSQRQGQQGSNKTENKDGFHAAPPDCAV